MNHDIQLTDRAIERLRTLMAKQPDKPNLKLRLTVIGGGCSGFQYNFKLDAVENPDDVIVEKNGVQAVIDQTSLPFVQGSIIDYKETMMGSAFVIENPNAASSCGCGNSFSI